MSSASSVSLIPSMKLTTEWVIGNRAGQPQLLSSWSLWVSSCLKHPRPLLSSSWWRIHGQEGKLGCRVVSPAPHQFSFVWHERSAIVLLKSDSCSFQKVCGYRPDSGLAQPDQLFVLCDHVVCIMGLRRKAAFHMTEVQSVYLLYSVEILRLHMVRIPCLVGFVVTISARCGF